MRALGVWRTVAAVVGLLFMTSGSLILSGYGGWPITVSGEEIFPFPNLKIGATNVPIHAGERMLRVTADDSLAVAFQLTTSNQEAVVTEVTTGKFRDVPIAFVSFYLGLVTATDGGGDYIGLNWSAPTVQRAGERVIISIEGRSPPTNGPVRVRTIWRGCPEGGCATTVVASTSKKITAIDPPDGVTMQTASSLELRSQSSGVTLTFEEDRAPDPFKSWNLPPVIWSSLASLWRQALLFGPWLIAFLWFRSETAARDWLRPPRGVDEAFRHLLVASMVVACVLGINLGQFGVGPLLDWFRSIKADWVPNGNPVSVPAIIALLALWTWRWRPEPGAGSGAWTKTWKVAILLTGTAAIALAVYWLLEGASPSYAPGLPNSGWVATGAALAFTGALQVSLAMRRTRDGIIDGLCAASLILILAFSSTVYSRNSAVISGLLTWIVLVAFLSTLIWVILRAGGLQRIERRPRRWLQAGILLFSAAFAVPPRIPFYEQFPISPYDAVPVTFAAEPFLRVGLILALVIVLRHLAPKSHPDAVWRMVAVGSVALLLLRPEKMLVGIPVSFFVGIVLTLRVLVEPRTAIGARALRPEGPADGQNVYRLLDQLRRIRTVRELRLALRKRVQSGDLSGRDADAVEQTVRGMVAPLANSPSSGQRHDALGWAGIGDPWRRALLGTAASSVLGILFSIPLLAQAISGLDLRGSEASKALLTGILEVRYPFFGFVFGYFLPLFRGSSGLAKALRFFIVVGASESIAVLLPYNPAEDVRGALTVLLVQLAMMCAVLGVGADICSLRKANEGVERLADLYNMSRLALWSSGVAVSVSTALITGLLGAALTTTAEHLLPPSPPPVAPSMPAIKPPAAKTQQTQSPAPAQTPSP